jgi:hypothetical protein
MKEGLLWFDNDPKRKLADKVKHAATCYQAKLQRKPTVCYMNADEFDSKVEVINGIYLKPAVYIQPHHYWVGVEQDRLSVKAA